jgi:hypothetical protein
VFLNQLATPRSLRVEEITFGHLQGKGRNSSLFLEIKFCCASSAREHIPDIANRHKIERFCKILHCNLTMSIKSEYTVA